MLCVNMLFTHSIFVPLHYVEHYANVDFLFFLSLYPYFSIANVECD